MSVVKKSCLLILFIPIFLILMMSKFMLVRVSGISMLPTLSEGQYALVLKGASKIQGGDIVLFISPDNQELTVKRCVLDENDAIKCRNGWIVTPWGDWFLGEASCTLLENPNHNGEKSFFMVGDNQFYSSDSRHYGFVEQSRIVGRVLHWRDGGR